MRKLLVAALAATTLCVVGIGARAITTSLNVPIVITHQSATLSVTSAIIDPSPNPSNSVGDVLEKVVDYFTDTTHTNPSVMVGHGNYPSGPGGMFLYVNNGSWSGTWTRYQVGNGNCYERARSITFAGDSYPDLIASCDSHMVLFTNPKNSGGDVTGSWPETIIDSTSGTHDFKLVDIDGDGKLDIVASASDILGEAPNFILYQNSPTSWTRVNGPGSLQDSIGVLALAGINGGARNNIVGPGADGSGIYWYSYPGSRTGAWGGPHYLGDANKGAAIGIGTMGGKDYVVAASNEDYPSPWPAGLAYYTQPADPTQQWTQTVVDTTWRAVHEISTGTFAPGSSLAGNAWFIAAEQEQACIAGQTDYHGAGIPCRVTMFYQPVAGGSFSAFQIFDQGTQKQAILMPFQSGILVVGANHGVYGGYPDLVAWLITAGGTGQTIAWVAPTNPSFTGGTGSANTAIATETVTMSPTSPAFAGTCGALTGTDAASFTITSGCVLKVGASDVPAGTYHVNVVPNQAGISNSGTALPITITANSAGTAILPTPPAGFHWTQTFGDDFSTTFANSGTTSAPVTLDTSHWQIDHYCGNANFTQYSSPTYGCSNSTASDTVSNGLLTMTVQTTVPAERNIIDTWAVAGSFLGIFQPLTAGFVQRYGYFVYDAKLPTCSGSEFDLESFGRDTWLGGQYGELAWVLQNNACNYSSFTTYEIDQGRNLHEFGFPNVGVDLTQAFHQYGLLWVNDSSPHGSVTVYFDGNPVAGPYQLVSPSFDNGLYFDIYWSPCFGCEGGGPVSPLGPMQFDWINAYQLAPN
jgi:FG-GAP-like repeat